MPTTSVTTGVDPAQWLPRAVYYYDAAPKDLVSVLSTDVT